MYVCIYTHMYIYCHINTEKFKKKILTLALHSLENSVYNVLLKVTHQGFLLSRPPRFPHKGLEKGTSLTRLLL